MKAAALSRSSGVLHGQRRDTLEVALDQADQSAGGRELEDAGDTQLAEGGHASIPAHRAGDLGDQQVQVRRPRGDDAAVGVGQQRSLRDRQAAPPATASANSSCGLRHVGGVERTGHRERDDPRAGRRVRRPAAASASTAPAATIWPATVDVGADQIHGSASAVSTVSVSPPSTADIEVGVSGAGLAHGHAADARPAGPRSHRRAPRPGAAAASSPTEWPAVAAPAASAAGGRREQRGRHHQGLGDGGVLDLVRVGRGAEPGQVETGGLRRTRPAGRRPGQLEPGTEHPGLLRALSGGDDGQHGS